MFETEIGRKVKREPALAVESRIKMFSDLSDREVVLEEGSGVDTSDVVDELWAFA